MPTTLVIALLAPVLVAAATVAARRFDARVGGIVSAFPAVVGPVLVIDLLERDASFAAQAAAGTLLGLVSLSVFAAAYTRLATRHGWPAAMAGGWAAAGTAGILTAGSAAPPLLGATVALASLAIAAAVMPRVAVALVPPKPVTTALAREVGIRMAASLLLVLALAAAAGVVGPFAGGVLAALPVLASVLAAFTHHREGGPAAVALLRGTLAGMSGFIAFCLVVALLVDRDPVAAFVLATLSAIVIQAGWAFGRNGHQRTGSAVAGARTGGNVTTPSPGGVTSSTRPTVTSSRS